MPTEVPSWPLLKRFFLALSVVFSQLWSLGSVNLHSTKSKIPPLLVNRFAKIRMLGEATMTGYPTGIARSRYAGPGGPKSRIPWVSPPAELLRPF